MRAARRASVSVEFVLVAPILVMMMFGIGELGLLLRASFQLHTLSRELARATAAGESATMVTSRMTDSGTMLNVANISVTLEYLQYVSTGTWSTTWQTVTSSGSSNNVPLHSQCRVTLAYDYKLLLPGFFAFLADNKTNGTRHLTAVTIMMRA